MDDDGQPGAGDPTGDVPDGAWPRILISNRQDRPVDEEGLRELARDTLRGEGIERAELSVSFVDRAEMAGLHERFMDEPGPTDVMSFPLDDADEATAGEGLRRLLGDVVVAPAEAARNNPDDPDAELRLLLVHGTLHLLGYDHQDDGARARMWERQERYSGVRAP
ncbi:MAG: rRNA maturation RNase YbeY [Actinomycetota bacterium]|nr:rRNA maturation RNase YbeY [Actinomycetota bacterium]